MGASERIKALAAEHGFPRCGIAAVPADGRAPGAAHFEAWLARGFHGPLAYLHESAAARASVKARFPWAKSVLCVGAYYGLRGNRKQGQGQEAAKVATTASAPATALLREHVARYAWGRDYHLVLNRRLKALAKALAAEKVCAHARRYVDTGPVLERAWAAAAGLGWIGKNTCLIHPRGGSYWVLGEIILDAELDPDAPLKDHCGTCRRCLEACPTGALAAPRVLDSRRCLATWNLELKNETPESLWAAQHGWAAGCDACQQVCPYNAPGRAGDQWLRPLGRTGSVCPMRTRPNGSFDITASYNRLQIVCTVF